VTCITMTDTTDLHDSSSNQDPSNVFQKKKVPSELNKCLQN